MSRWAASMKSCWSGEASLPIRRSRLARYFNTTPQFWLNLQIRYELDTARLATAATIEKTIRPAASLAVAGRRGWQWCRRLMKYYTFQLSMDANGRKNPKNAVDTHCRMLKITANESGTKAILPEPRSVKKRFPISCVGG